MPPSAILVVSVPTVDGREDHLVRCEHAYHETTPPDVQLILDVRRGRTTCGQVWNESAARARFAYQSRPGMPVYFHATADDLEPLPGWFDAARRNVTDGASPSALIYTARPGQPDVVESHGDWGVRYPSRQVCSMSRIPFCLIEQWIDIPQIHYYSDNAFTAALQAQKIPCVAEPDYAFRHWWAEAGRHPMNDAQWYAEQAAYTSWAQALLQASTPTYL
jgi:hypothetical protein